MRTIVSGFVAILFGLLSACQSVKPYDPVIEDPVVVDKEFPFELKEVYFISGGVKLWGQLATAQGKGPHPTVIVVRGFPNPASNVDVVLSLQRAGFNTLTFYYRGFWGMGGSYTMMNSLEDLKAAVDLLRTDKGENDWRVDPNRIALMGYSFGGPISIKAASQDPGIRAVILIDPSDLRSLGNLSTKEYDESVRYLDRSVGVRSSGKQVVKEIVEQQAFWDPIQAAPSLAGKCVLTVWASHGEGAELVAPYFADAMRTNDRFTAVTLDTTHSFADHRIALSRTVVSWVQGLHRKGCL